jgi:hypothetical protein
MAAATSRLLRMEGLTSLSGISVVEDDCEADLERLKGEKDERLRDLWRECVDGGGDRDVLACDDVGVCGGGVGKRGKGMLISVYNGSLSWMLMWWIVASESKVAKMA